MDTLVVSIVGSVSIMVGFIIGYYLRGQWVAESLKNLATDKQRLADE